MSYYSPFGFSRTSINRAVAPDFESDYSTAGDWTAKGSNVLVDDASFPDVLKFNNSAAGADNGQYQALGFTLNAATWVTDFEWTVTAINTNDDALIFFSNGNGTFDGVADGVGIEAQNITTDYRLNLFSVETGVFGTQAQLGSLSLATTYYGRLNRLSGNLNLDVFSDSGRTTPISGSPIQAAVAGTVGSLDTIQHLMRDSGSGNLTATVDTTKVWDGISVPP